MSIHGAKTLSHQISSGCLKDCKNLHAEMGHADLIRIGKAKSKPDRYSSLFLCTCSVHFPYSGPAFAHDTAFFQIYFFCLITAISFTLVYAIVLYYPIKRVLSIEFCLLPAHRSARYIPASTGIYYTGQTKHKGTGQKKQDNTAPGDNPADFIGFVIIVNRRKRESKMRPPSKVDTGIRLNKNKTRLIPTR
jgi:hypothetical protein